MIDPLMICRVCGHDHGDYVWGEDGKTASFEICDCCGLEFGYEDSTLESITKKRSQWIDAGAKWSEPSEKPEGWNVDDALARIPDEFKG